MKNVRELNLRKLENQVEENSEEVVEEAKEQIGEGEFLQLILQEINNKTYHLVGGFDEEQLKKFKDFASNVYFYENDPNPTVNIHISSRGGQVDVLLAILSEIENLKEMWGCKVACHIDGYAFSCGALLFLLAGDIRTMGTHSQMMMHEVSYGYNNNLSGHEKELKYTKKLQDRIDRMIIENTDGKITKRMLNKWYNFGDTYFFKEDLEKLGILTVEEEEKENEDK
jgi:ATP-dependent protease ClpP protease subunit